MRPAPIYRIHDTTLIHARRPDPEAWQIFRIRKKTANSVFIDTPDGPVQLDRVGLERAGQVKRRGRGVPPARSHLRAGQPIGRSPLRSNTMSDTGQNIELNADGTIKKTDVLDVGVPIKVAPAGWVHPGGPEDALDSHPTRGDYRDHLGDTIHTTSEAHPVNRLDSNPPITLAHQNPHAENIVDSGGPLDEADPDYAAKKAAIEGQKS